MINGSLTVSLFQEFVSITMNVTDIKPDGSSIMVRKKLLKSAPNKGD